MEIKKKWESTPTIGKIGLIIAIVVPFGLMLAGIIAIIIKLSKKE